MQELLERKSFQKITVNDICQDAMVSRSTFYLHFEDKYQLLMFFLQNERKQLEKDMRQLGARDSIREALCIIKDRKRTYRNIFEAENNSELFEMFVKFFLGFVSDTLSDSKKQGVELIGPVPILSAYYASGIAGTILWWIKDDFSVPIDEMALCLYNLLSDIIPE
jgi:AcrR family transcriptional regulator